MHRLFRDYLQGLSWAFRVFVGEIGVGIFLIDVCNQIVFYSKSFQLVFYRIWKEFQSFSRRASSKLCSEKRGVIYDIYFNILRVKDRISMICERGSTMWFNIFILSSVSSGALLVNKVEFQVNFEIMQACIVK